MFLLSYIRGGQSRFGQSQRSGGPEIDTWTNDTADSKKETSKTSMRLTHIFIELNCELLGIINTYFTFSECF